jgi:uncharacterized protein YjbJ (UPF0337 family)
VRWPTPAVAGSRGGEVEQAEGKAKGAVDSAADTAKNVVDRD